MAGDGARRDGVTAAGGATGGEVPGRERAAPGVPLRPGPVLVVGSYNRDLVVTLRAAPRAGETVLGEALVASHGGKGSNQAVAAARLGAAVRFVGRAGADAAGAAARALWAAEGIDARVAAAPEGVPTGTAVVLVEASGENRIVVVSGANASLDAAAVRAWADAPGDVAVVLGQLEVPAAATLEAFRMAPSGALRVLNAAPAPGAVPDALLGATDLLLVNAGEAGALGGAGTLVARWPGLTVVVTLGAEGARCLRAGTPTLDVPSPAVRVVDTTGAGDAFAGALVARLAAGAALPEALRYAAVAGALACTAPGAVPSLPGRAAIAALVEGSG